MSDVLSSPKLFDRCHVALFLDLDNLVIGANEVDIPLDLNLLITSIQTYTNGRLVLRRAYGDWRQHQTMPHRLASFGFELQSVVRLNTHDKNAADMQMLADAADTLINPRLQFDVYVLATGDRDFIPLVQLLRRYNKTVIGIGLRQSTNSTFAKLCDDYLYYDDMVADYQAITDGDVRKWVQLSADEVFATTDLIQASLFRDYIQKHSHEQFSMTAQGRLPFGKALEKYDDIVKLHLNGSTLYVYSADKKPPEFEQKFDPVVIEDAVSPSANEISTHSKYGALLKKQGLRIVPSESRLLIIKDIVRYFAKNPTPITYNTLHAVFAHTYEKEGKDISKSMITDVFRIARRAGVIHMNEADMYANQQVSLSIQGDDLIKRAIILIDKTYMEEIEEFATPFEYESCSLALYQTAERIPYLQHIHQIPMEELS